MVGFPIKPISKNFLYPALHSMACLSCSRAKPALGPVENELFRTINTLNSWAELTKFVLQLHNKSVGSQGLTFIQFNGKFRNIAESSRYGSDCLLEKRLAHKFRVHSEGDTSDVKH